MTRRQIILTGEDPVTGIDPGPRPALDWVRVDALVIDDSYQRPLDARNWARIRRIAESFHWSKFSPMMVARLDNGTFAVIDGQHRAHAAALCGIAEVPALVLPPTAGPYVQAHAFVAVNGTALPLTAQALFRAALAVREPWAIVLRDTVEAAGLTVATWNPPAAERRPYVVYSIGTIRALTEAGHAPAVTAGLQALRDYDSLGRVGLYDAFILKPWLRFVVQAPAPVPVLVQVLERRDPFKVLESAQRSVGPHAPYGAEAVAIWTVMKRDILKVVAA